MYKFTPGSTSKTVHFKLRNASTGLSQTGCTAAGITASYTRTRGSATPITVSALGSATAAWSAGGFFEISPTLEPGVYRFDVPDAALATGADFATVTLQHASVRDETALIRLESTTNNVGPGSISWTINVSSGGDPVSGAEVWISTDADGANVVAGVRSTDDFGNVTFLLDTGTYYAWVDHPDYTEPNPTTFVVS